MTMNELLRPAKTRREARKKLAKLGCLPFSDIPAFFGQLDWERHCHECRWNEGHAPDGAHQCGSPYGTLGCFEKYEKKKRAKRN